MPEESVALKIKDELDKAKLRVWGDDIPPTEPTVADPMKVAMYDKLLQGALMNCIVLLAEEIDRLKGGKA